MELRYDRNDTEITSLLLLRLFDTQRLLRQLQKLTLMLACC